MAEGARKYGVGSGAAHLVSGHSRAHAMLEEQLAEMLSPWIPQARALFFCAGYMANLAATPALVEAGDTASKSSGRAIFADVLNHASLIDATRLARDASRPEVRLLVFLGIVVTTVTCLGMLVGPTGLRYRVSATPLLYVGAAALLTTPGAVSIPRRE